MIRLNKTSFYLPFLESLKPLIKAFLQRGWFRVHPPLTHPGSSQPKHRGCPIPAAFPMRLLLMTRPKSITSKPPASHPGSEIKGFLLRSETRGFFSAKNDRTLGQTWASIAKKKAGCKWVIHYTFFCFFVARVVIGLGIEN